MEGQLRNYHGDNADQAVAAGLHVLQCLHSSLQYTADEVARGQGWPMASLHWYGSHPCVNDTLLRTAMPWHINMDPTVGSTYTLRTMAPSCTDLNV